MTDDRGPKYTPGEPEEDEHFGRRHLWMRKEHKRWGRDFQANDIDYLLIERDVPTPRALIEYKHERIRDLGLNSYAIQAVIMLGNWADLPVFITRYADDVSWFHPIPLNARAEAFAGEGDKKMAVPEYVAMLYRIMAKPMPADWEECYRTQKWSEKKT